MRPAATSPSAESPRASRRLPALVVATLLTGVIAGLGATALMLLLHFTQHVAYGYRLDAATRELTYLEGVTRATPQRRVAILSICGAVAGVGWWALYRFGAPLVAIRQAIGRGTPAMPLGSTIASLLLQIVTVALGSPLGREVAPRELAAALSGRLVAWARLDEDDRRTLIACAAGAGLAAVYNVPLGGALFTIEVLLERIELATAIPALATAVIAALIAWLGVGDTVPYAVERLSISAPLLAWSVVAGPILGLAAFGYARLTGWAGRQSPRDARLLVWCPLVFVALGGLAVPFPQLLGNGKGPTLLGFQSQLSLGLAATLLLLKAVVIVASMRAGAKGGLLTPSLTLGALAGTVLGGLWNLAGPTVPLGAYSIVGATAFLAATMKMPFTALVLAIELTRAEHDFWFPMIIAVAGAVAVFRVSSRRAESHQLRD